MKQEKSDSPLATTEHLAQWVSGLRFEQLSHDARRRALQCVIDAVACAAGARDHPAIRQARAFAVLAFPGVNCGTWFDGLPMSTLGAAFVHASSASILDFDDGHRAASGHPGAAVVPAVLTLARATGSSLPEVLAAVACGYEVGVRLARARNPSGPPSVASGRWTTVAVAAAAALLLRQSPQATANAIAIAESLAPNLLAADHAGFAGSEVKEGIAWSALTGLAAVQQAALGSSGYLGGLDNPSVYGPIDGQVPQPDEPWLIERTYFKPYACCRWIHGAIDAALAMREQQGFTIAAIQEIEVATFARALSLANQRAPDSPLSAQFSVPFCVALALIDGRASVEAIESSSLGRSDVLALSSRIRLSLDESLDAMFPVRVPARVRIVLADGPIEQEVLIPSGDPDAPMTQAQFTRKLSRLLGPRAAGVVDRLVPMVFGEGAWSAGDIEEAHSALFGVLAPPGGLPDEEGGTRVHSTRLAPARVTSDSKET